VRKIEWYNNRLIIFYIYRNNKLIDWLEICCKYYNMNVSSKLNSDYLYVYSYFFMEKNSNIDSKINVIVI